MNIRRANENDTEAIMKLLSEVLEIHARLRPDIFISGTTKYSAQDLAEMYRDESRPIYVAIDEAGCLLGYAFCQLKTSPDIPTMLPHKSLYIDDLCVEESARGRHVGRALYAFVKAEAARLLCRYVDLTVWEGNEDAMAFYRSMGMTPRFTHMEAVIEND